MLGGARVLMGAPALVAPRQLGSPFPHPAANERPGPIPPELHLQQLDVQDTWMQGPLPTSFTFDT